MAPRTDDVDGNNNDNNNMMTNPPPRKPSLREQAALRAQATSTASDEDESPSQHESFPFPNTPHTPENNSHHPLAFSTHSIETPEQLAHSARKEWRQHGSGLTQSLEDKRRLDEQQPGTLSVRVLSADTRRDVAGRKYTAYILRVQLANGQVLEMEHRYSEFAKLHEMFVNHGITLSVAFPSKHWAGRMGNWTPSLRWAPEQHQELIDYRKIQLDVWLVHVVSKYNLGELPHSVHDAVYEFFTTSDRPPCEQENVSKDDWKKWNNPLSFTLGSTIRQATATVEHMCIANPNSLHETDQSIPLDLLSHAKGLCFLTVIKAGLVVSGRVGTGLLIAKTDNQLNRWSAPCALGTVGIGWGMLAGGDITHYLVVLTTTEAVDALIDGTVQLGAELGVAVGPVGRGATSQVAAGAREWAVHPAYSYAHSQGLFFGISLEGSVLTARNDVNAKFYGQPLPASQVLDLPPPKAAQPLYEALGKAFAQEIPKDGFRPSQLFQESNNLYQQQQQNKSRLLVSSQSSPMVGPSGRVTVPSMESPCSNTASPI